MSRQLDYQRDHLKKGLCTICPRRALKGGRFCVTHLRKARERARKAAGCQEWQPGRPGRPPKDAKGT